MSSKFAFRSPCPARGASGVVRRALLLGFVAAVVMMGSLSAQAASPRYTFVEGGWLRLDPDRGSSDNGFFVGGQWGGRNFQIFADYGDTGTPDIARIGAGWHGLLGKRADVVVQAAYVDSDAFKNGYQVEGGVRWMVLKKLEVNGFLSYMDTDRLSSTALSVAGIWDFTSRFGVGAEFEGGDDLNQTRVFARWNFGKQKP
jgi:hypothetical protein